MIEYLKEFFDLLRLKPELSIILLFGTIAFLAWLFRDTIARYIKKKYNLYDEHEIREAMNKASEERVFYSRTSEKLTPSLIDRFFKFLKEDTK